MHLDPTSTRALAHPIRLKILGRLRATGPATSTTLAAELGVNTGSTSYHLRQLAASGFVEEAPERGNRKERWWRSVHRTTRYTDHAAPDSSGEAFIRAVAQIHAERMLRAADVHATRPAAWQNASTMSDWLLLLTVDEAARLNAELIEVIDRYRRHDPESVDPRPDGTVPVGLMVHLFPTETEIGTEGPEPEA